tara:strand:+ start:1403 stop:2131 length:729 start_codon:yes stop_codon:yes gene_type:complete
MVFNNTMSELNSETLKNLIVADRMTLLNTIVKDMTSVSAKDASEYLKNFGQKVKTYLDLPVPELADKKRKKKVMRFRKISPYLAYCAAFRDSKRGKDGKLKENVLDITREAGARWKKMSEKDRKPWIVASEKLTAEAKVAWDKKMAAAAQTPTAEAIRGMKKTTLLDIADTAHLVVPNKLSLKDLRELVVAHFYPATEPTPTADQIVKMKKSELLALVDKAGITSKKETKAMQQALISHYSA